jgi:5-formyltetrahydrofolate cyclo-ligase
VTKPFLRKTMLGRRDAMDAGMRTVLSRAILRDIGELAGYLRSDAVMTYSNFGSELQTDEFMLHLPDRRRPQSFPGSTAGRSRWMFTR